MKNKYIKIRVKQNNPFYDDEIESEGENIMNMFLTDVLLLGILTTYILCERVGHNGKPK